MAPPCGELYALYRDLWKKEVISCVPEDRGKPEVLMLLMLHARGSGSVSAQRPRLSDQNPSYRQKSQGRGKDQSCAERHAEARRVSMATLNSGILRSASRRAPQQSDNASGPTEERKTCSTMTELRLLLQRLPFRLRFAATKTSLQLRPAACFSMGGLVGPLVHWQPARMVSPERARQQTTNNKRQVTNMDMIALLACS